jgi:hypothetical protein
MYRSLGKYVGPEPTKAAMTVRDLLSATHSLLELPADQLRKEANDIELAHALISRILKRVTAE